MEDPVHIAVIHNIDPDARLFCTVSATALRKRASNAFSS
jgi:hypothetical protein